LTLQGLQTRTSWVDLVIQLLMCKGACPVSRPTNTEVWLEANSNSKYMV